MSIEVLSRRYASALADVVEKTGESETIKAELKQWEEMMASSNELKEAFSSPAIAHLSKEAVLEKLIAKSSPSKTTANFLKILLKNGRISELAAFSKKFEEVLEERAGIITAKITSARELADGEKSGLQASIEKMTGRKVKLEFDIDENIIGGVVTRVGSTVYDGSVRTQLENLKQQLVNG
jgi:F-type H+-transporting ATPase subunit delta